MLILDVTVVASALPQMEADLSLSREALTWVVAAYTVAFGGLLRLLPPLPPRAGTRARLDLLGAALVTGATGLAIYALTIAGEVGWTASRTLLLAGIAVVLYLLFGWWQRTTSSPLMDLSLLGRRPVLSGVFVLGVATALMVAVFFLGTFYFQQYAGHGPLVTGLLFLPIAVATMAGAQLAGRLVGRLGARRLGVVGMTVGAVGLLVPALSPTTLTTTVGIGFGALGIGMLFVVASVTALGNVAPEEAGIASGLLSTFHEIGASVGVASVSSIAVVSLAGGGDAGFQQAFLAVAVGALLAALVAGVAIPGRPRAA